MPLGFLSLQKLKRMVSIADQVYPTFYIKLDQIKADRPPHLCLVTCVR